MKRNRLKQLWAEGKPGFGFWAMLGGPATVEALARLGPDWISIDAEHGAFGFDDCLPLIRAMNGTNVAPFVRVPSKDPVSIKRVIDWGALGIFVPQIRTAEEVAEVVSTCRYPPVGTRGIGPTRASNYFLDFEDYHAHANDEIAVIVQIETREAVENLEAILAVPGLDGILIGPADLSAALGYFPDVNGEAFQKVVAGILETGRRADIPVGYYCFSGEEARQRAEQGFRFVSVVADVKVLTAGFERQLADARGEAS